MRKNIRFWPFAPLPASLALGMRSRRVIVVGGGAAGFFAAITCAEALPGAEVTVLEKGARFLGKVLISGGGRCNVTNGRFDSGALTEYYPRGARALLGPCRRFEAADTIAWFEARGVKLKMERDGRMFPITDSSQTIVDCLMRAAFAAGVTLQTGCDVTSAARLPDGSFALTLANGQTMACDRLLLATGGCRGVEAGALAASLGHSLAPIAPSLFTFHIETPWLRALSGVSVEQVTASIPGTDLRETGPILLTHWGVSGPVILRLSAWGARRLQELNYQFILRLNWLPGLTLEEIEAALRQRRESDPARLLVNAPIAPLPARLWERLVLALDIPRDLRCADLSRAASHALLQQLTRHEFKVTGKSLNKDEFVTCGGVRLNEVNFQTMESRVCPGLYFAGELLDIDGVTGGYNFQAAWTTGWIAGHAMAS
jgi:predicted Rossmann fold flavoprotein